MKILELTKSYIHNNKFETNNITKASNLDNNNIKVSVSSFTKKMISQFISIGHHGNYICKIDIDNNSNNYNLSIYKTVYDKNDINNNKYKHTIITSRRGENIDTYYKQKPNLVINNFKEIIIPGHSFDLFDKIERKLNNINYLNKVNILDNNNEFNFVDTITFIHNKQKFTTWNEKNIFHNTEQIILVLLEQTNDGLYSYLLITDDGYTKFKFHEKIIYLSTGTNNTIPSPYMFSKNYFINLDFIYDNEILNSYWLWNDCKYLSNGITYPVVYSKNRIKPLGFIGLNILSYDKETFIINSEKIHKLF